MRIFIALLMFMILFGCQRQVEKDWSERQDKRQQQAIDACIKAGGIPIFSAWDRRMIDCKFPPRNK